MGTKLLVIDDDPNICDLLKFYFENEGYEVKTANDGIEGLSYFKMYEPDLVLLDLMLPGLSGEELLPLIKNVPIIVVSAKAAVQDKVDLLLGGAADYITKPFDTSELLARVAVRLRESYVSPFSTVYVRGDLKLDTASHGVSVSEKPVSLTRTEYAILKLLMQNSGQVMAKSVLLERISEDTPDCTENSLKTHISNLRGKLREASGKDYIEAVWGIGFRLRAET